MSKTQTQYLLLGIVATVVGGLVLNAVLQRYPRL